MSEEKLSLFQKIQAVSNEIRNIAKDMTVGTGAYSYKAVSDLEVTLAVKDAETKFKLVSIPIRQELVNSEIVKTVNSKGEEKLTFVDTIKMTVLIQDLESSDKIEIESFGKGIDSGDKGFGKASTYARKIALLNVYKIATGEDPDADKSEDLKTPKTVSDKKKAVLDYLNLDVKRLTTTLQHHNVATADDFTEKQINEMYATLNKKGLL